MRSVNKVILVGNLTRDPESRSTDSGQQVTTFGIATNRDWTTKDGSKKNSAEYHECVAWARLAEICAQYLKKGKLVYVEGYLKTRSWDTPEGVKKFKTEIIVQDMIMLEKRPGGEDGYDEVSMPAKAATEKEMAAETTTEETTNKEIPANGAPAEDNEATPEAEPAQTTESPTVEAPEAAPVEGDDSIVDKDLGL
jgi:single-strand DNA-binding protein